MNFHLDVTVDALRQAPRIRFTVADPNGGENITGTVVAEISETHVRFRSDDGLTFRIAKAALRVVPDLGGAS